VSQTKELFGLALLGFLETTALFVVSPILPQYAQRCGASYAEIGYFFTAYSLTWTLLQLYTGYLSDKYGKKKFVLLGLLIYGVSAMFLGLAQNFVQLILFRVLQGVGLGIFGPAALGLVAQFKQKGESMAFYRTANGAGIIIGPLLGGAVAGFNISYPFFISGLASLVAIASLSYLTEEKVHVESTNFIQSLRSMLSHRSVLWICVAAFLVELCFAALDIVIPLVGSSFGFSSLLIGVVLSSYFLAFTVTQIPIGFFSEKVGKRKLVASAAFAGSIPFVVLYFSRNPIQMSLSMGVLGVMLGVVFVQSGAIIAQLSPPGKESLYMAFFDAVIDFSFPVIPVIITYLVTMGIKTPFLLLINLMILSGIIFATGK
jgi:DHA1 family multidrug resistance protein-like MFS transporter